MQELAADAGRGSALSPDPSLGPAGDTSLESVETLDYADACLRESLRLFPGAATGNREAQRDCVLDGETPLRG